MIGIITTGRLGNQMFQYAFGKAIQKKYNTKVVFINREKGKHKFKLFKYFNLYSYNHLINELIASFFLLKKPKRILLKSTSNNLNLFSNFSKNTNIIVDGYFQSERYFYNIKNEIENIFEIKKIYIDAFNKKYSFLFKQNKIISVHIRRGDYVNCGNINVTGSSDMSLPINYYYKCLIRIKDIENYKVIFVSDDINWVKTHFEKKSNFLFEENHQLVDFQIIKNSDIAIIANSSFSWWAAYLNKNPKKIIYAPKYWLGYKNKIEYPAGITSVNWNWIY